MFIPVGECFLCINTFLIETLLAAVLPSMNQLQFSDHSTFVKGIGRSIHDVHPVLNGEKPEVTVTTQERAVLRFEMNMSMLFSPYFKHILSFNYLLCQSFVYSCFYDIFFSTNIEFDSTKWFFRPFPCSTLLFC